MADEPTTPVDPPEAVLTPPGTVNAAHNGHKPDPAVDLVVANYQMFATQLGAILTLLANLPLPHMMAACKRLQTTSVLTMPANVTAEQARLHVLVLHNDERILAAALELQRVAVSAAG